MYRKMKRNIYHSAWITFINKSYFVKGQITSINLVCVTESTDFRRSSCCCKTHINHSTRGKKWETYITAHINCHNDSYGCSATLWILAYFTTRNTTPTYTIRKRTPSRGSYKLHIPATQSCYKFNTLEIYFVFIKLISIAEPFLDCEIRSDTQESTHTSGNINVRYRILGAQNLFLF